MISDVFDSGKAYIRAGIILLLMTFSNYGMIAVVTAAVTRKPIEWLHGMEWIFFLVLLFTLVICQKTFQSFLVIRTYTFLYNNEMEILRKVRSLGYRRFESLRKEQVFSLLEDTNSLVELPTIVVTLLTSGTMVLCCLVYMFFVSVKGAIAVIVFFAALATFYSIRQKRLMEYFHKVRALQQSFYKYLNDFLNGFKELKLRDELDDVIFNKRIVVNRNETANLKRSAGLMLVNNEIVGNYLPYLLLGAVIFALPVFGVATTAISSFVLVLLYVISPLTELINGTSRYPKIAITMKRIKDFNETLDQHSVKRTSITKVPPPFSELRFEDVCFKYRDEVSNETFDLGPINITIDQGKIIFIAGGNGSGKSTFVKILTGIYTPDSGRIFLNGEPVALENYGEVRNLVSAVFTDNHLFSENYLNHDLTDSNPLMREYLEMMRMNGIFRLNSNENADAALSKGQQKRVALILALLDDRPILVLDEWAAEQDPGFRKYFYEDIIRTLCARNKTLLLVTHDEAHFIGADRIIKFDYGLCQEESPAQTNSPASKI